MMALILWIALIVFSYNLVMMVLGGIVFILTSIFMILSGQIRQVFAIICVTIVPMLIQCAYGALCIFIIKAISQELGLNF